MEETKCRACNCYGRWTHEEEDFIMCECGHEQEK